MRAPFTLISGHGAQPTPSKVATYGIPSSPLKSRYSARSSPVKTGIQTQTQNNGMERFQAKENIEVIFYKSPRKRAHPEAGPSSKSPAKSPSKLAQIEVAPVNEEEEDTMQSSTAYILDDSMFTDEFVDQDVIEEGTDNNKHQSSSELGAGATDQPDGQSQSNLDAIGNAVSPTAREMIDQDILMEEVSQNTTQEEDEGSPDSGTRTAIVQPEQGDITVDMTGIDALFTDLVREACDPTQSSSIQLELESLAPLQQEGAVALANHALEGDIDMTDSANQSVSVEDNQSPETRTLRPASSTSVEDDFKVPLSPSKSNSMVQTVPFIPFEDPNMVDQLESLPISSIDFETDLGGQSPLAVNSPVAAPKSPSKHYSEEISYHIASLSSPTKQSSPEKPSYPPQASPRRGTPVLLNTATPSAHNQPFPMAPLFVQTHDTDLTLPIDTQALSEDVILLETALQEEWDAVPADDSVETSGLDKQQEDATLCLDHAEVLLMQEETVETAHDDSDGVQMRDEQGGMVTDDIDADSQTEVTESKETISSLVQISSMAPGIVLPDCDISLCLQEAEERCYADHQDRLDDASSPSTSSNELLPLHQETQEVEAATMEYAAISQPVSAAQLSEPGDSAEAPSLSPTPCVEVSTPKLAKSVARDTPKFGPALEVTANAPNTKRTLAGKRQYGAANSSNTSIISSSSATTSDSEPSSTSLLDIMKSDNHEPASIALATKEVESTPSSSKNDGTKSKGKDLPPRQLRTRTSSQMLLPTLSKQSKLPPEDTAISANQPHFDEESVRVSSSAAVLPLPRGLSRTTTNPSSVATPTPIASTSTEAEVLTAKVEQKNPAPVKRQSRRIAAVSALPKPRSGIPSLKVPSTKATAALAPSDSTGTTPSPAGMSSTDVSGIDQENMIDAIVSNTNSNGPVSQEQASTSETTAVTPGMGRAMRSRPVRGLNHAASAPRSPTRRALGASSRKQPSTDIAPPKTASKQLKSDDAEQKAPPRGAARQKPANSRTNSAINAQRSPTRVTLASPARTTSALPRSPVRSNSAVQWSIVPAQPRQNTIGPYSPEAVRRAASKVFGAGSIPSRLGGVTKADNIPSSPNKTLQQRMPTPASPSLLEIAVAPELLILTPPVPALQSLDNNTTSVGMLSHVPSETSLGTPTKRDLSMPPMTSHLPAVNMSPRRAFSAQPTASPRKADHPSPRRIFPGQKQNTARLGMAASASAAMPPQKLYEKPSSTVSGTVGGSTITFSTNGTIATQGEPAQRRSQRSARPRPKTLPISQAAPTASTQCFEDSPTLSSAPSTSGRSNNVSYMYTAPPALTPAQLISLTNKNTVANRQHYNIHDVTTIYMQENRPPSPTSKIRKSIPGVTYAPFSSSPPGPTVASSKARAGSATDKNALQRAVTEMNIEVSPSIPMTMLGKRPHFRAAGDDEEYESPVKKWRLDPNVDRAKNVKWDRDLLKRAHSRSSPSKVKSMESELLKKRVYKHATQLDSFGNVPDCKSSLSPVVPRTQVPISKLIYKDDPLD